jgi:hypothetical protein
VVVRGAGWALIGIASASIPDTGATGILYLKRDWISSFFQAGWKVRNMGADRGWKLCFRALLHGFHAPGE